MSAELLERLLAASTMGFEDTIARAAVLVEVRGLDWQDARAFYVAALERPELAAWCKAEIARELEWWRSAELVPELERLVEDVAGVQLHIEVLTALASGEGCVCDVYVESQAKTASPLMDVVGPVQTEAPQDTDIAHRCTVCGTTVVQRQSDHGRGAVFHSWYRQDGG